MSDCLFCKIRDGEIPAAVTYRDEHVLAFKDVSPKAPFHQLVIPLRHVARLADATADDAALLGRLMLAGAQLARDAGHADGGYRVVMNNGADAGQTVLHVHLHVLAGRALDWPPG
ncbi:MAG: histidine triad nucleotide-binding protein [Myxococcales bacterium]|nr:histidine triad nucleotide-binding protein [Myxococcales bacterium]